MDFKEDNTRNKLLLFEYFLIKWNEFENNGIKNFGIDQFLKSLNWLLMNKFLYLTCLGTIEKNKIDLGIFKVFNNWIALEKGPCCINLYANRSILYNFEFTDDKKSLQQRSETKRELFNIYKYTYPDLVKDRIKGLPNFQEYMSNSYVKECGQIDNSLKNIFEYDLIKNIIKGRKTQCLVDFVLQNSDMWTRAKLTNDGRLSVDNPYDLQIEKERMFVKFAEKSL